MQLKFSFHFLISVLKKKRQLKPSHESQSNTRLDFSPLLETTLSFNPKLFNGALNEQLVAHKQRNYPNQQSAQIKPQQQQQQHSIGQLSQNASINGTGASMPNQQQGSFPIHNKSNIHIFIQ